METLLVRGQENPGCPSPFLRVILSETPPGTLLTQPTCVESRDPEWEHSTDVLSRLPAALCSRDGVVLVKSSSAQWDAASTQVHRATASFSSTKHGSRESVGNSLVQRFQDSWTSTWKKMLPHADLAPFTKTKTGHKPQCKSATKLEVTEGNSFNIEASYEKHRIPHAVDKD